MHAGRTTRHARQSSHCMRFSASLHESPGARKIMCRCPHWYACWSTHHRGLRGCGRPLLSRRSKLLRGVGCDLLEAGRGGPASGGPVLRGIAALRGAVVSPRCRLHASPGCVNECRLAGLCLIACVKQRGLHSFKGNGEMVFRLRGMLEAAIDVALSFVLRQRLKG